MHCTPLFFEFLLNIELLYVQLEALVRVLCLDAVVIVADKHSKGCTTVMVVHKHSVLAARSEAFSVRSLA